MTVLFVVATIVAFLTIDYFVRRLRGESGAIDRPAVSSYPVRLPDGIFFSPSHTWLNLYPSGHVRLGVDDFILRLVGEPSVQLLKKTGDDVEKGDPLMLLKERGHSLTVRSPFAGKILEANEDLPANPAYLKDSLFSSGWGYVIKPANLSDMKQMLIGGESRSWIRQEFHRLRDFFAGFNTNGGIAPAYLQDGGPPMAGIMNTMDDAVWRELDDLFLQVR